MDHEVLLLKLKHLGFKHGGISWFRSYLVNRKQSTRLNGVLSDPLLMNSGVPQGSILGPLLFICYINDLPNCLHDGSAYIYADDTAILVKGASVTDINEKLESELINVCKWFDANKMSVNSAKTNTMLLCGSRSKHRGGIIDLTAPGNNNVNLEQVSHTKYLGVEIDEHLSFTHHIDKLCSKIRS